MKHLFYCHHNLSISFLELITKQYNLDQKDIIVIGDRGVNYDNIPKNLSNITLIKLPKELIVHVHQGSIDYPRDRNGKINGIIHPDRLNQDWKHIKKGDPLFLDLDGNSIFYNGAENIWPVFIGEAAYKDKNIAMSFTKKEVIFSSQEWLNEFLSL